jgi:hypothetical protein
MLCFGPDFGWDFQKSSSIYEIWALPVAFFAYHGRVLGLNIQSNSNSVSSVH